jgi:transposase
VLARIAACPDLTLRSLLAQLADRGVLVSYYAVWHFFEHEGISFKKKPARGRAGSTGRGAPAKKVAAVSRPA